MAQHTGDDNTHDYFFHNSVTFCNHLKAKINVYYELTKDFNNSAAVVLSQAQQSPVFFSVDGGVGREHKPY